MGACQEERKSTAQVSLILQIRQHGGMEKQARGQRNQPLAKREDVALTAWQVGFGSTGTSVVCPPSVCTTPIHDPSSCQPCPFPKAAPSACLQCCWDSAWGLVMSQDDGWSHGWRVPSLLTCGSHHDHLCPLCPPMPSGPLKDSTARATC